MKKFIAIIVGIVILIGIIFAVKSCNPRVKPLTEAEEFSAFIQANIDFTCLIKNSPEIENDSSKAKSELTKIYEKYHFPTNDDQAMMDILNKYSGNSEIINQVKAGINNC